ncbi:MAG: PQQ-dependent sugar dehydrogenase, partial [Pirellulaceae bacterium]
MGHLFSGCRALGWCALALVTGMVPAVVAREPNTPVDDELRTRLAGYERYALQHAGNAEQGRTLFHDRQRARCTVCHRANGEGGQVGPDLSAVGGKFDRPHLIESLLEPSRQIVEGYRMTIVQMTDGRVLSGIVKERADEALTLHDANDVRIVVARADIEDIADSAVSIMPADVVRELTREQFTDLIAYLETLRAGVNLKFGAGLSGPVTLPPGFEVRTVVTGLSGATALETLRDGRVLVCEQVGTVRVVEDGELLPSPLLSLPVDDSWERGVLGVTVDPDFPRSPFLYVCWVARDPFPHHRISRFTVAGNSVVEASERVLLVGDDQRQTEGKVPAGHQGGAVHFGPDGKLYIGIGEHTAGEPAQRLDSLLGKLLRIESDGSIPGDNPFRSETSGKYRAIWARGLRNPFTFAIRPDDGLMLINDVGGAFEEVNRGRAGANYGWPSVDHGPHPERRFENPVYFFPQSSLAGGAFADRHSPWPEAMRGRYFFADFVQGWIRTLDPDRPAEVDTFATGFRRPVDLR